MNLAPSQLRVVMCTSAILLAALIVARELVLAPLRPGGSMLVLLALPLVWVIRWSIRRDPYGLQIASMMILGYLAEGAVRVYCDTGLARALAILEIVLVLTFFAAALAFLAPLKRAAKRRQESP